MYCSTEEDAENREVFKSMVTTISKDINCLFDLIATLQQLERKDDGAKEDYFPSRYYLRHIELRIIPV